MMFYRNLIAPAVALMFGLATALTAFQASANDNSPRDSQKVEKPQRPDHNRPDKPEHPHR